jgi:hypothetical protein
MSESDCPRNLTTIQCGENPVNQRSAQDFQMFSTSEKTGLGRLQESWRQTQKQIPHDETVRNDKASGYAALTTARNSMGPSAWIKQLESRRISAQPKRKTEIEKRS